MTATAQILLVDFDLIHAQIFFNTPLVLGQSGRRGARRLAGGILLGPGHVAVDKPDHPDLWFGTEYRPAGR
uniref:Uncharacterized protein n=1 Tax=Oryza rufipogon TaxID=4529 RepID=A0A0E0NMV5_ORYRU